VVGGAPFFASADFHHGLLLVNVRIVCDPPLRDRLSMEASIGAWSSPEKRVVLRPMIEKIDPLGLANIVRHKLTRSATNNKSATTTAIRRRFGDLSR
jgi:hypothetical protein